MRRKWTTLLAVLIASTILVATAYAGGWAVVTVRDLPEYAVAGKPLRLEFLVRGAGISPAAGLKPKVAAMSATGQMNIKAVETKKEGEYTATLVIPTPGIWTIRIDAFGDGDASRWSGSTLPKLAVIAPESSVPTALSPAAAGERLFVAKGCEVCHISQEERVAHARELQSLPDVLRGTGLDLSDKHFTQAKLEAFLAHSNATFGHDSEAEAWSLPNIGLTRSEIADLTAFFTRDRSR